MKSVGPHAQKLMAKDESFFMQHASEIEFLRDIQLDKIWTPETSDNTKNAIWQYMQTLHILGTTLSMFPPETLSAIENAAKKVAESGAFDPSAISGLLGGLMSGGGDNPLAALLGSGAAPRPGARQVRRRIAKKPAQKNPGPK